MIAKVIMTCKASYPAYIDVPDSLGYDYDKIAEYINDNLDRTEMDEEGELVWLEDLPLVIAEDIVDIEED